MSKYTDSTLIVDHAKPLRIVHLSDIHLDETPFSPTAFNKTTRHVPNRYGHNSTAFINLDNFLNNILQWDVLVITGDLSRNGLVDSFANAYNWICHKQNLSKNLTIGLGLDQQKSTKHWIVIPGNHDMFNGHLTQQSLNNYEKFFSAFNDGDAHRVFWGNVTVRFHTFNTCWYKGGFAKGELRATPKFEKSDDCLDIALLHHHLILPPQHSRDRPSEIKDNNQAVKYFFGSKFDAVLFGHFHKSYLDYIPSNIVKNILPDKRAGNRLMRALRFKFVNRREVNDTHSYHREKCADGKYPKFSTYFIYMYAKHHLKLDPKSPADCRNSADFDLEIERLAATHNELSREIQSNVLVSMAPSSCQAEASYFGFHYLEYHQNNGMVCASKFKEYRYNEKLETFDEKEIFSVKNGVRIENEVESIKEVDFPS